MLQSLRGIKGKMSPNALTLTDVVREVNMELSKGSLYSIAAGKRKTFYRPWQHVRVTRFLKRVQAGLVIKRNGKVIYLDKPIPDYKPPKPAMVCKIFFYPDTGRPVLTIRPPAITGKNVNNFFGKAFGR
jgi:hypothetical protein